MEIRCPSCGVINPSKKGKCAACGRDLSLPAALGDVWQESQARNVASLVEPGISEQVGTESRGELSNEQSLADRLPGSTVAAVVLTVGEVASALASILALVGIMSGLDSLRQLHKLSGSEANSAELFVIANGLLQVILWAAAFIAFGRIKVLTEMARRQDEENRRIWKALAPRMTIATQT